MDRKEILALYDEEMRRRPAATPGTQVEDLGQIVRIVGEYNCIIYSDLGSVDAVRAVADQTAFFREKGREVEWKLFGHDRPPELGDLLRRAGYLPEPAETLVVHDLAEPLPVARAPEGLEVRLVGDEESLRVAVAVSEGAFGPGEGWKGVDHPRWLRDAGFAAFVAYRAGVPVASGRLEMPPDRSFASLWGGGTVPGHRGAGIYQRLVAARAELARRRGYRYLTVDARESSRPILERLGFEPLDTTSGWILRAESPAPSSRDGLR